MMTAARPLIVRGELQKFIRDLQSYDGEKVVIEALIEGPRGSAKSRPCITFFVWNLMCEFPGCRILVVRKFRSTLSSTFCQEFEQEVVPPEMRADVVGDAQPDHRTHYSHPNGSWCGLVGLDRPSKYKGMNIDVLILEEASELLRAQVEMFTGAVRKFTRRMPWQLILALTNPDAPGHWLNQRALAGKMRRVKTLHKDNPKYFRKDGTKTPEGVAFMDSLNERYTGVAHDREVKGLWRGAEGMVWENYDDTVHIIPYGPHRDLGINRYFGSQDWGFAKAGSLSIWGLDNDGHMTRVAHVYHTKKNSDWWAAWAVTFIQEYHIARIVSDPARPDMIDIQNDRLVEAGHPRITFGADNTRRSTVGGDLAGLDLVRWGFEKDAGTPLQPIVAVPRIRIMQNGLRHAPDAALLAANKPWSGELEIPQYVFARDANGEIVKDQTDSACEDHFCDEMRYAASDNWRRVTKEYVPPEWVPPPGSYAHKFGTPASLAREKARRERDGN